MDRVWNWICEPFTWPGLLYDWLFQGDSDFPTCVGTVTMSTFCEHCGRPYDEPTPTLRIDGKLVAHDDWSDAYGALDRFIKDEDSRET